MSSAIGRERRVAIVTGASSGIGAAVATMLGREGWNVALAARSTERLRRLAAPFGGHGLIVPTDVTSEADRLSLVESVQSEWGRVDVLVNNAGYGRYATLEEYSLEDVRDLFETNVLGLIHLTQLTAEVMRKRREGHIVLVASIAGHVAAPPLTVYASTKHAVVGFGRALHRELRDTGVNVSVVTPGPARTGFGCQASGRQVDPAVVPGGVSAERVARAVRSVIRRPRREAFVPAWQRLGALVEQLFPAAVDRYTARVAARWRDGWGG